MYIAMNDKIYDNMLLRRRFCKRVFLMCFAFIVSFYVSVLLFGDMKSPRVLNLTELSKCPACYGVSVCPELYSNQIIIDGHSWTSFFNTKNVYYGYTTKSNRRVVLKKLAHNSEFKQFDQNLCKNFKLKRDCKPIQLLNYTNIDEKILEVVRYNFTTPDYRPRKGLVMCPYPQSIFEFIEPIFKSKRPKSDLVNVYTMLSINPEPIVLQVIPKTKGWPVPAYGGVCGRIEVVAHEGESLSSLTHIAWYRKLKYAKKILDAAMDFTFKHDRFRFYLMDWSLDNIVANEKDEISFIDLEDVVVLDKHVTPGKDLPDWYQRYGREDMGPGFTFSIQNMCKHHLSDHNIWAACYILVGDEDPFLYPIPKEVNATRPHFDKLLKQCVIGTDRFKTLITLQHVVNEMLEDESIVGFGAVVR